MDENSGDASLENGEAVQAESQSEPRIEASVSESERKRRSLHVIADGGPEDFNFRRNARRVQVVDFDMPFGHMVIFLVKWAIASIPAIIFLFVIFSVLGLLLMMVLAAIGIVLPSTTR